MIDLLLEKQSITLHFVWRVGDIYFFNKKAQILEEKTIKFILLHSYFHVITAP